MKYFFLRTGIIAIVGEVVPFRLTVGKSIGGVGMMSVLVETETSFGIEEVVFLVDIQIVLADSLCYIVNNKFVVVSGSKKVT